MGLGHRGPGTHHREEREINLKAQPCQTSCLWMAEQNHLRKPTGRRESLQTVHTEERGDSNPKRVGQEH